MTIPTPADMANLSQGSLGSRTRFDEMERPDIISTFALFPYRGAERIDDVQELKRQGWSDALQSLAGLAEEEDWAGSKENERTLPILDSYIRYTYQRLVAEQKILMTSDGKFATFNTGLLSRHSEEIFALFKRNDHQNAQPWFFLRWAPESDLELLREFSEPPEMAQWVVTYADLVFDVRRTVLPNWAHILDEEHLARFPVELGANPLRAKQAMSLAIELAKKRARRNYKIAVPQWYPKTQLAGFLLPLDLFERGTADLALVVSVANDTTYRGHTVLTLDMAYTVARLVSRPDSDWLKPQAIPDATDEDQL